MTTRSNDICNLDTKKIVKLFVFTSSLRYDVSFLDCVSRYRIYLGIRYKVFASKPIISKGETKLQIASERSIWTLVFLISSIMGRVADDDDPSQGR